MKKRFKFWIDPPFHVYIRRNRGYSWTRAAWKGKPHNITIKGVEAEHNEGTKLNGGWVKVWGCFGIGRSDWFPQDK